MDHRRRRHRAPPLGAVPPARGGAVGLTGSWSIERVTGSPADVHRRPLPDQVARTARVVDVTGRALVLGSTQPAVQASGIDVVRRRSGGGAVLVGDYVYGSHVQSGMPQCLELLTGKMMWKKGRGPGSGPAAVAYADGNLYFQYENGVVALVAATPAKYQLKGQFQTPDNRRSLAHPAISNGRLYLRDQGAIYCYDLKKK